MLYKIEAIDDMGEPVWNSHAQTENDARYAAEYFFEASARSMFAVYAEVRRGTDNALLARIFNPNYEYDPAIDYAKLYEGKT